jgi:hypothetical protein
MNSLEEQARDKRLQTLARISLKRVQAAGIPEKYWRIKEDVFQTCISPEYHKNPKEFALKTYEYINDKCDLPYILIDGGNIESRQVAGFALLFRFVVYNRSGLYKSAHEIINKLSSFQPLENLSRNEFAEQLKTCDVLFISEFRQSLLGNRTDIGGFLDEILNTRSNSRMPTIMSFTNPIKGTSDVFDKSSLSMNDICGIYMARLLTKINASSYMDDKGNLRAEDIEPNPHKDILRIRTRVLND